MTQRWVAFFHIFAACARADVVPQVPISGISCTLHLARFFFYRESVFSQLETTPAWLCILCLLYRANSAAFFSWWTSYFFKNPTRQPVEANNAALFVRVWCDCGGLWNILKQWSDCCLHRKKRSLRTEDTGSPFVPHLKMFSDAITLIQEGYATSLKNFISEKWAVVSQISCGSRSFWHWNWEHSCH